MDFERILSHLYFWVIISPSYYQFKCYSQWRIKATFSVKMLWFMINNKWIENEFEQPSSEPLLGYLHYGFFPKHIFNTENPILAGLNFRGQKRQSLMQMTKFLLSVPYIFICQEKLTAKVCRFVNQNIFEIFVIWHHHSAKSLSWPEFHTGCLNAKPDVLNAY